MRIVIAAVVLASSLATLGTAPPAAANHGPRAFGSQPLDDVIAAANQWGNRCAGLTADKLAAIMLAPVWYEAGPGDSTTVAPSPMTLSRWDVNEGLYAFGSSSTPYQKAFWHPGIGLWQFDDIGGWAKTAAERINTASVAYLAADVISSRFCGWNDSTTSLTRFEYTLSPWHGCKRNTVGSDSGDNCFTAFQHHYNASNDSLRNLSRISSVTRTGGMVSRTCQVVGETNPRTCWLVNPAMAQGYTGWRSSNAPTPLSSPFYVYSKSGREYRHWLREDSGYSIDITASKPLAANSRKTSSGYAMTWTSTPMLCDVTVGKGACDPQPPSSKTLRFENVQGTYAPFTGDFNGDGRHDVFWYAPGTAADSLWSGKIDGTFSKKNVDVDGTYEPLIGDFDGNGADDVVWYAPGTGTDRYWRGRTDGTFTQSTLRIDATFEPFVGHFDGDGRDDIFWYGPGADRDSLWRGRSDGTFRGVVLNVRGTYAPSVGDFDCDERDDVLWFANTGASAVWFGAPAGEFASKGFTSPTDVEPLIGNYNGGTCADIFWYGPGSTPDSQWLGKPTRTFAKYTETVRGTYDPFVVDLDGDGHDDIVWYAPGVTGDTLWSGASSGNFDASGLTVRGTYVPLVGQFDGVIGGDVVWYAQGAPYDGLWYG